MKALALAAALLASTPASGAEPRAPAATLLARANAAFAGCASSVLAGPAQRLGLGLKVEVGNPALAGGADLIVGDDDELTRVLEGGRADAATAVDLGYVPWALVTPAQEPARSLAELALADEPLVVLGGAAGRSARAGLPRRLRTIGSEDPRVLARAPRALVPLTLAGPGRRRLLDLRPLVAVAAVLEGSPGAGPARRLLASLSPADIQAQFARCAGSATIASAPAAAAASHARAVVDWWLPACSLARNGYNDPAQVLGAPDAANLGGRDNYRGFMSLGQGGYVVVDMGATFADRPGPEVRVYQSASGEEVTVYASAQPAGPFTLLGLRRYCGVRSRGLFSNHCDFDLAEAGLAEARYLKVEDGEIYPCRAGDTISEGPDVDAVELLAP